MSRFKNMKTILVTALEMFLIVFLLPLLFVAAYFLPLFFGSANRLELARDLAYLSLSVSGISAPLLIAAVIIMKLMIRRNLRWYVVLATSYAIGFIWLSLWNFIICDLFGCWRSVIPLTLCCGFTTVYALAKAIYKDDKLNFSAEPELDYMSHGNRYSVVDSTLNAAHVDENQDGTLTSALGSDDNAAVVHSPDLP